MQIKTILVPTDFSDHSNEALEAALSLAKAFGAKVEILHAFLAQPPVATLQGGYVLPDDYFEEFRKRAKDAVAELVAKYEGDDVEVTGRAVESAPSAAILEAAESDHPDLIVMGTRGTTGLKHVLLGSVAERVVRMAPCPVLTLKSKD